MIHDTCRRLHRARIILITHSDNNLINDRYGLITKRRSIHQDNAHCSCVRWEYYLDSY